MNHLWERQSKAPGLSLIREKNTMLANHFKQWSWDAPEGAHPVQTHFCLVFHWCFGAEKPCRKQRSAPSLELEQPSWLLWGSPLVLRSRHLCGLPSGSTERHLLGLLLQDPLDKIFCIFTQMNKIRSGPWNFSFLDIQKCSSVIFPSKWRLARQACLLNTVK